MYLSKLNLNLAHSWYAWIVRNPWQTHRTIMRGFPQDYQGDKDQRILFRLETNVDPTREILVQSLHEPDWSWLYDHQVISQYQVKTWEPTFNVGDQCLFRLLINPVGNHSVGPMGGESVKRKPVDDNRMEDWLARRQANLGFEVVRCQTRVSSASARKGGDNWIILGLNYDGLLRVTDPATFEMSLRKGLGKSRGFGYGLLSVSAPLLPVF